MNGEVGRGTSTVVRLLAALVILLAVLPAAADPAGDQAAAATMTALRDALAGGDVDAVVGAMGSRVTTTRVILDGSCAKQFPIFKKRTLRGSSRTRFVRCLVASWQAPTWEPELSAQGGGGKAWLARIGGFTFQLAKGSRGAVVVTAITGDAPNPDEVMIGLLKTNPTRGSLVGAGKGTGTGVGGGGQAEGDFVSSGSVDVGGRDGEGKAVATGSGPAPKQVTVATGTPAGDLGGLTADEIDRVIRSRAGVFRACYQKELNRTRGLAGKVVLEISIGPDGAVTSVRVKSTTMKNEAVELCLRSNAMRLRFPAKGAKAVVVYPLVFDNSP